MGKNNFWLFDWRVCPSWFVRGNYAYEQEVKALHVYADSVFHEAFHVELQKRGMDQVESWRYGCEDSFVSSVDTAFKKVTIQDEYGTYSFRLMQ